MIRPDFLPLARPSISDDEVQAVVDVVKSGWWTTGPKVFEFEKSLSTYLAQPGPLHCVALNSCTSALFLGLYALGIRAGDEVIVPTWTFAATAQVVEWLGAKVVLCDIEEESLNIDLTKAASLINADTKAVIPVHLAGYPCHMTELKKLADRHNLKIIEDAAHAVGSAYNGKKIGNFSDLTCFSFYATKNMAMGEGGAAVSSDAALIEKIRKLSYFGINKEAFKRYDKTGNWFYDIEELGFKCNLDSMHAALGLVQLQKIDSMNKRRRQIAATYRRELADLVTFTRDSAKHYHTYHLFPILLPDNIDRNTFIMELKRHNIGAGVHFIPLHKHTYYQKRCAAGLFPKADKIYDSIVSIPMFPAMTDEDVGYVVTHIKKIVRKMS